MNNNLSLFVLSCDAYADLWDDFFNLRDLYWKDCPFEWYIVTETREYKRNNVNVIACGKNFNWSGRFRHAVNIVSTKYIGIFLEDYFITDNINTQRIINFLRFMESNNVDYLNVGDVFGNIIYLNDKTYFSNGLINIPKHQKYGISMASAIWDRKFLLEKLGTEDYSAWQFEVDRCREAASENGLTGLLLCDENRSFNITTIPVVIQGKFYPKSIKEFAKRGYHISIGNRKQMSYFEVILYDTKVYLAKSKHFRKFYKWIGKNILRIKFFTDD